MVARDEEAGFKSQPLFDGQMAHLSESFMHHSCLCEGKTTAFIAD
jgi:hypothetical protein